MDDKFLYENRPPVRPGFGQTLYARISKELPARKGFGMTKFVLRLGLASLILLGALLTVSQPVRAAVLQWIKQVAGFEVSETDSLELSGEAISVTREERDSLANLKDLPFEFARPAYVPDGFIFEDRVEVQADSVFMRWLHANGDEILMQVDTDHGQRYLTGTDAAQEIEVDGQPAMFVPGGYDLNGNWDPAWKMLNLIQRKDNLIYWLIYVGDLEAEFDADIARAELVQMMGSIPALQNFSNGEYTYTPQPVDEIIQTLPFAFEMPGYLPAGFVPHEGIVAYSKAWVLLSFRNDTGQELTLLVQKDWPITIPAGTDSAEEVLVAGNPALLIRGGYGENNEWDETQKNLQLYWRTDKLIYLLSSQTVGEEELIRIAESLE